MATSSGRSPAGADEVAENPTGQGGPAEQGQALADAEQQLLGIDEVQVLVREVETGFHVGKQVEEILAQRLQGLCDTAGELLQRVLEFIPEAAPLLVQADRVIAMGGYNTVAEVLSFEKPALIVPRATEQSVRAERLRDLGLVDVLHLDRLHSAALAEWLSRDIHAPRVHERIRFDGLSRLPGLVEEVLSGPCHADARRPYGGVLQYAAV